jgi:hypothetical protein
MNRVFDYNGTIVAPSNPVKKLKTVKKKLIVDSGDRDIVKYSTNGDFLVYLPRVYENVVSIRLEAGEFPPIMGQGANTRFASDPTNLAGNSNVDPMINYYFLMDIKGLNKTDECSVGADRSGYPDGTFAKIPLLTDLSGTDPIFYSDNGAQENIAYYTPAIGKLDRMHIRTRLHTQKTSGDWFFWINGEYSLTFEIEYLDNVFDDFSQFESRISDRA